MAKVRYPSKLIKDALRKTNGRVYLAARSIGCDPETIYKRAKKEPGIQKEIDNARGIFLDECEDALGDGVKNGEAWAVCFALKTIGKHRGYIERQEVDQKIKLDPLPDALQRAIDKAYGND